jgi:hypothetical protein
LPAASSKRSPRAPFPGRRHETEGRRIDDADIVAVESARCEFQSHEGVAPERGLEMPGAGQILAALGSDLGST